MRKNENKNESWAICAENLRKTFGKRVAVNNISLKVRRGEIFGFLGPNGSGKTTTIRMLCGLLTPDEGQGTCLGFDLIKQVKQIKAQVGYMTQRFSLYEELTVYENLDFVARIYNLHPREKFIQKTLNHLGLDRDRQRQLAGHLSGGWKQRLALAAATLHQPQLLLLDEPTAGVDPKARREFWEYIHQLSQAGVTILVSTHYMDEAERCDRLAYIAEGELLAYGKISEIIEQARLTTYQIFGENLGWLEAQLKLLPEISGMAILGQSLHVSISSVKADLLDRIMNDRIEFKKNYKWRKISPTLEDLFIYFMKRLDEKK